ncbi:MAG: ribonuclease III [Candidatus Levyibacteriota bacterium]
MKKNKLLPQSGILPSETKFKNKKLFDQAFTHRSYLNEIKHLEKNGQKVESNERLEFLGDSILSFIVSDYLFKKYPSFDEGTLTNLRALLVNTKSLALIAKDLDFGNLLKISKGEEESKGRQNQSMLADSFEAFIGALFIDQGISIVYSFLEKILLSKIEALIQKSSFKDPKSLLQESVQSKKQNSPIYKVLREKGPAHDKIFTVGVFVQESMVGSGLGRSKQEAEENAAKVALEKLRK